MLVTESLYAGGIRLDEHVHTRPNFCFVLEGGFEEVTRRYTTQCAMNALVFRPGGQPHANNFAPSGGRCLSIECPSHSAPKKPITASSPKLARWIRTFYREFTNLQSDSLVAECLVLEVQTALTDVKFADEAAAPKWLLQIRDKLEAEWMTSHGLSSLALEAGVHPVHLSREFHRFFRCSLGDYQRMVRVRKACEDLKDTSTSLGSIALQYGFSDQAHFTRIFKQHLAVTPGYYRSQFLAQG